MIKDEEVTVKNITNNNQYDNRGFMLWQLYSQISYKSISLKLSDTPSGCGPLQMYNYNYAITSQQAIEYQELFEWILYKAINGKKPFHVRIPTSINFVQGVYGYNSLFFETIEKIGFERLKEYKNIAHGKNSKDIQRMYHLDLTKLI